MVPAGGGGEVIDFSPRGCHPPTVPVDLLEHRRGNRSGRLCRTGAGSADSRPTAGGAGGEANHRATRASNDGTGGRGHHCAGPRGAYDRSGGRPEGPPPVLLVSPVNG